MSQGLCPSCGAAVNLTAGQNETKCQYCETVVSLQQAEAQFTAIKNSKFGGTLLIAETAQEGGSYAEAFNYYNKVIEQEPTFADAWLNKGTCMVRSSKIGDLKFTEAISSWKAAIKFAKDPGAMEKRIALEINNVVADFYPVLEQHFVKFSKLLDSYSEHLGRFEQLEAALALALHLRPHSKSIAENGVYLCERVIETVREQGNINGPGESAGDAVVKVIATKVQELKRKYEEVLAKVDPVGVEFRTRQVREKKTEEARNKMQGGLGCGAVIGLVVGGFLVYGEIFHPGTEEAFGTRIVGVMVGIVFLVASIWVLSLVGKRAKH